MALLSFNSRVVSGRVGHAAGQPALERLGHDVWPTDTTQLSNHPGHGVVRGGARTAEEMAALVDGVAALDRLAECEAVFSGYLGTAGTAAVVADAVARVRTARPGARYICDPVLGDEAEGLYVPAALADAVARELLPLADLLLPNAFELGYLTGAPVSGPVEAAAAARRLGQDCGTAVVVTGLAVPGERLDLLVDGDSAWLAATPEVATDVKGAGDLFAGIMVGRWLDGVTLDQAMADAASVVHRVLEVTAAGAADELMLLQGLDDLQGLLGRRLAQPFGGA